MKKNKWIALIVITVAFFIFMTPAFLNINTDNPFWNLISFVMIVAATLVAIFVGNNEPQENH